MADEKPQNFENHARQVPVFAVSQLVLMVNLVGRLIALRNGISFGSVMNVLIGAALIALFVMARNSTLAVQNCGCAWQEFCPPICKRASLNLRWIN